MAYNTLFDLDLTDIEIIEKALNKQLNRLSENRLMLTQSTIRPEHEIQGVTDIDNEITAISDLLGKLHNQKIWYRPNGVYISG